ncbi:carboxymuconolactone decarboxylase family protein [Microbacterium pygmaeum]|uniref:Alkylhydroperoxidase AhpD family core domain-containing protein n=1 Tax=Microbacterium pygmaeum TaxID=370764 RepID=A0A1G8CFF9_9MICO|nr:carboxymuconolactone decarboxylase family protein [Microbacterium pygmaeum]SDH44088.1 alkylhydroperoxidase AhpD family core domain-containing protein [Microbacterium pygmaeum]
MSEERRVHLSKSAPEAYKALAAFSKSVGAIAVANGIDDRLKELVQIHTSQLNGCAYCVRVHVERAAKAGISADTIAQLPVWRESGVFSERERAGLELAEAFTYIHEGGIAQEVYEEVGGILSEDEYVGLSWILVAINAFNRVAIAGRYSVPPRDDLANEDQDAASGAAW